MQDRNRKGSAHRGYLWTYLAKEPGLMFMEYTKTRCRAGPEAMLADYIRCDTDRLLQRLKIFDRYPLMVTYACWAHARR